MHEFIASQVVGINGLINLSNVVFLVAFSVRDVLKLRILAIVGEGLTLPYYYFQNDKLWPPIVWGAAFMDLIFSLNPTFVARGFSGDIKLMTRILKAAIQHRGFAFVEMLQACPTYNHFATHEYLLDRYFDANADGHDPSDLQQARALATQVQDRIACGILYQREDIPDFYSRLIPRQGPETTCVEEVRRYDVSEYWKELV